MIKRKDGVMIPKVVIERLPKYFRYLDWLDDRMEKISSKKLGELMGSSASQVRLDLSYFGDFGQQGYGYNVKKLKQVLADILRINAQTNFIIVGAGNIGRALTRYNAFKDAGFVLKALFDVKKELIGKGVNGITIRNIADLDPFVKENTIDIAVLAVPIEAANKIAKDLIRSGIKGILNFAPVELEGFKDFPVENIHIIDKMLALSFILKSKEEK